MSILQKHITHIDVNMDGGVKFHAVTVKQGDRGTRCIIAHLFMYGEAYQIPTDAIVNVNIAKPDGKYCYNSCEYEDSQVTIDLKGQEITAAGIARCEVEVKTADETQSISSGVFYMEIEESARNDSAVISSSEFTAIEKRINEHIEAIVKTNEKVSSEEEKRVSAEKGRSSAEKLRDEQEKERQRNENTRISQEKERQNNTSQAVKNAETATTDAENAAADCRDITNKATDVLQNQEQLEATLNVAIQMQKDVSNMQDAVMQAKQQVENDKKDIDDTIQGSLLASAEKILESVKDYFNRAEALYESLYLSCDGETPYLRAVTPVVIDGATPQVRTVNVGIEFDGGTPMKRQLAA